MSENANYNSRKQIRDAARGGVEEKDYKGVGGNF